MSLTTEDGDGHLQKDDAKDLHNQHDELSVAQNILSVVSQVGGSHHLPGAFPLAIADTCSGFK
jgi:hypothetical protein